MDPASVPIPAEMVNGIAHWQGIAGAFEVLELDSGPYEALAQSELVDLESPVNEEGLVPVSYTHLDVYKRQGQDAALEARGVLAHLDRSRDRLA